MRRMNRLAIILLSFEGHTTTAWSPSSSLVHLSRQQIRTRNSSTTLWAGANIEQPPVEDSETSTFQDDNNNNLDPSSAGDIPLQQVPRGKVNEIDFCIAPADVSLSRAYGTSSTSSSSPTNAQPTLSLTRALNNASNRAVRRIILARSWPSAEALNLSLRQVAKVEKEREEAAQLASNKATTANEQSDESSNAKCPVPRPILNVLTRRRKDKQEKAKTADEKEAPSPRSRTDAEYIHDQIKNFKERYGKLPGYSVAQDYLEAILCLATSGVESTTVVKVLQDGVYDEAYKRVIAVLNSVGIVFEDDPETKRQKIASKIIDQDICLSMIDKIQLRHPVSEPLKELSEKTASDDEIQITKEDLGGVLLSGTEPSMTRQLNSLANIVERALLFGGDQELLVLAETLDADRAAFVDRWYPNMGGLDDELPWDAESRPGVQFLNCLVHLLRDCYTNGVVTSMDPPFPLAKSYANAYERLVASVVELGSGYLKPLPSDILALPKPRTAQEELGRFAVWETTFRQRKDPDMLINKNASDLFGTWEVRDVIAGETIGTTLVKLLEGGTVQVKEPLEGLTWRLDPGPTHLDTCTFQVLNSDGTVLQYRGFLDRGARLEARFSKRSIRIRGSVQFQMRDSSVDYYKDILPINYKSGTTKFIMTKIDDEQ